MTFKDLIWKVLVLLIPWQICARILPSPRQPRLSLAEPMPSYYFSNINGHPGTYSFGYDVSDPSTGNTQFRSEERYPNGTVTGSYGYVDPNGRPHRYRYIADEKGYRVMRDRPRSYAVPPTSVPAPSLAQQENEVTWTRKKPNNPVRSSVTGNRYLTVHPKNYFGY